MSPVSDRYADPLSFSSEFEFTSASADVWRWRARIRSSLTYAGLSEIVSPSGCLPDILDRNPGLTAWPAGESIERHILRAFRSA